MNRLLQSLVLPLLLTGQVLTEEPVYIPDAALKAAVENTLWISDPTPTDMLDLTKLLCLDNGVADLTGLEYAVNLQELWLRSNPLGDIAVIGGLDNLETLHITICGISDISVLSGLSNLQYLDVHGNQISDISPVSALDKLETLIFHRNQVSDISAVSGLSNLRHLDAQRNQVSDVSPVSGLTTLDTLLLEYNQVSDISALSGMTSLQHLDLRNNPLNDEAYDVYIPLITANNLDIRFKYDSRFLGRIVISSGIGGRVTDPGEGEFIHGNLESVFVTAEADPGFVFAGWSGTYSTPKNPACIRMDQDHRIQANFLSTLDVLHVDDDAAGDSSPGDPARSDPRENGTPEHPLDSIRKAIEVAAEGATIIVHSGIYREDIDLLGKDIHLMAMDPNDPTSAPYPVIEGTGAGPVVRFNSGEGLACTLTGFVITAGKGQPAGAILCDGASPTLTHCLIVGNRSTDPAGAVIYCVDSQAVLANCTIADNYAGTLGATLTLLDSNVTVLDSILWNAGLYEVLAAGTSKPDIRYCGVRGWWADWGNIHKDPLFARPGIWVNPEDPSQPLGPEDPQTILIPGDYHLKSQAGRWDPETQSWVEDEATSPCIDAGLRTSPVGHEPAPNGDRINMGAYSGTTQASMSHLPVVSQ